MALQNERASAVSPDRLQIWAIEAAPELIELNEGPDAIARPIAVRPVFDAPLEIAVHGPG
jgi:hypothetical protein